jgi:hypothetical protein
VKEMTEYIKVELLEAELNELIKLELEYTRKVAIAIHNRVSPMESQCNWNEEGDNWEFPEHSYYFHKAEVLIDWIRCIDGIDIYEVFKIVDYIFPQRA